MMSMRCLAVVAIACSALTLAPRTARAEGGPFGLGIIVGQPTGVTAAYRLGDRTAIDGALGVDLFEGRRFYLHGTFLFVLPDLLGGGSVGLSPYLGPGVFVNDRGGNNDRLGIGVRAPFGLSLDFRRAPLQIFGEFAVLLPLIPDPDLGIGGAVGFRYYF
jgi:hypothetical protein